MLTMAILVSFSMLMGFWCPLVVFTLFCSPFIGLWCVNKKYQKAPNSCNFKYPSSWFSFQVNMFTMWPLSFFLVGHVLIFLVCVYFSLGCQIFKVFFLTLWGFGVQGQSNKELHVNIFEKQVIIIKVLFSNENVHLTCDLWTSLSFSNNVWVCCHFLFLLVFVILMCCSPFMGS
jgi:hypothetical protein